MALIRIIPVLFVFFSTPIIDSLQDWGTSKQLQPDVQKIYEKINEDPNAAKVCGNSDLFKKMLNFVKLFFQKSLPVIN